jgi:hypothetical protein
MRLLARATDSQMKLLMQLFHVEADALPPLVGPPLGVGHAGAEAIAAGVRRRTLLLNVGRARNTMLGASNG